MNIESSTFERYLDEAFLAGMELAAQICNGDGLKEARGNTFAESIRINKNMMLSRRLKGAFGIHPKVREIAVRGYINAH